MFSQFFKKIKKLMVVIFDANLAQTDPIFVGISQNAVKLPKSNENREKIANNWIRGRFELDSS